MMNLKAAWKGLEKDTTVSIERDTHSNYDISAYLDGWKYYGTFSESDLDGLVLEGI